MRMLDPKRQPSKSYINCTSEVSTGEEKGQRIAYNTFHWLKVYSTGHWRPSFSGLCMCEHHVGFHCTPPQGGGKSYIVPTPAWDKVLSGCYRAHKELVTMTATGPRDRRGLEDWTDTSEVASSSSFGDGGRGCLFILIFIGNQSTQSIHKTHKIPPRNQGDLALI